MTKLGPSERVRIWNSFFLLARREAKTLFELQNRCQAKDGTSPLGGMLNEEQRLVLSTLAFCTLAVEARANHLIHKLVEEHKISQAEGDAAEWLAPERKLFLLPKLAGRRKSLDPRTSRHRAVVEICSMRNDVAHVRFARLSKRLPTPAKMLALFEEFVDAMDNMNTVLRDSRGPRKRVREMGRFKCI